MDLRKLISGSDIRGKAVGEDAQLTPEVAQRLGTAFALFLAEKKAMSPRDVVIGLGRDSRITGPALLKAVADIIRISRMRVTANKNLLDDFKRCFQEVM